MRTISYKLDDLKKIVIPIGFEGENDHTRVIIDAGEVFAQYPSAAASLRVKTPQGSIYPVVVNRDGDRVIWNGKDTDCASDGNGEAQFTFTENNVIVKSVVTKIKINRSLKATGPAPDPIEDWLDTAEDVLEEVQAAEVNQPTIGEDGYWYTWDQETGEYEKTNTKAQGADGHSPVLTSSKSGKTTTLYADGEQIAQIQDGEDGQGADVIDDTAGEGDTDKTWSADKLTDEFGDVLTAIHGVEGYLSETIGSDNTVAFAKTVPAGASYAFVSDIGTKTLTYNQHFYPLALSNKNGLDYTTDETNGWTTIYGTSSANVGFRPCDKAVAQGGPDVIPLGHIGAVIIETDGITLQTSLSAGFQIGVTSGPGYSDGTWKTAFTGSTLYSSNDYTWGIAFRCGSGKSVDGKLRVHVFDLTVMFGSGNEPATLNDFLAIFTGSYYTYDKAGTQITIACDKILLNGEEQNVSSFAVSAGDTITIHTSTSIANILMPVWSTVTYNGMNYEAKEEAMAYQTESAKVTTDLLNESADLRIMLFTDNHDYTDFKYKKYADMMSHGIVDYLVGLGDYKDYSTSHDKIWYKTNLLNALTKAGREGNCLYVVGNHDVGIKGVQGAPNSADYLLNPMECFDVLNRNYSKNPAIVYDEDNPFGGWYYLDDEKSKIRMIVLQSSDIFKSDGSFVRYKDELMFMSQGQLTWFCEQACNLNKTDTTGWGIIVFIHCDKPYGSTNNALFKILKAVKNGTSITETFTIYQRMTLDGNNWTTTRDEVNGDTLEIDSDYTSQGAIDVLGVIHGHGHADDVSTIETINDIQVRCDNGVLDDYYLAPVDGITAGTFWWEDVEGKKWAITYSSSYADVKYIGYNYYFTHANVSPQPISRYDSSMNRIRSNSGCSLITEVPAGATEVTGFFRERGNTRIGQESAEILCINRENRTLTFIPYGTATKHTVSF